MKKTSIIIFLILLFIIIYLLQANLFSWFNITGVKPNLFVILTLIIGLFAGRKLGIVFGIFFGLIIDFLINKSIGIASIMLELTGIIGGYLDKNFSKDSRITMITMIVIATLIYELGTIILNLFINDSKIVIWYVLKTLIIELIYNSIITIIIYPIIIKFGYILEETFKTNKIMTRYY